MSYVHKCPCGGDLYLIGFTGSCSIPISRDGFYLGDGACDTENEVVACDKCGKTGPLESTDADLNPDAVTECEDCGTLTPKAETHATTAGRIVCDTCAEDAV